MDTTTRAARDDETGALRHIWKTVFGDGDVSLFFDHYFDPDLCVVADREGVPAAAGYLLPTGSISFGERAAPCAMVYGVATLPEHRNLGLGAAVVRSLVTLGYSAGFPAIALCPSNDSLFGYYSARTGFRDWFYIHERRFDSAPATVSEARLSEVSPHDYGRLRERFLSGIPHLELDIRALSYQGLLCKEYGGGLFAVETPGGDSCVVVERQDGGVMWIKELLAREGFEGCALSSVASAFPAGQYVVRTPAERDNSQFTIHNSQLVERGNSQFTVHNSQFTVNNSQLSVRRFGMVVATGDLLRAMNSSVAAQKAAPWLGLAFD